MLPQQRQEANDQKRALSAAQERLDADQGWALMRKIDAAHFEQGYLAAQMGLDATNAGLYSTAHREGYRAAKLGQRVKFVSAGAPALLRQ